MGLAKTEVHVDEGVVVEETEMKSVLLDGEGVKGASIDEAGDL